jgi:type IV secretory pathway VirB9-like protein
MRRRIIAAALLALITVAQESRAQDTGVREVSVTPRSLAPVNTSIRNATMLFLPDGEEVKEISCGDPDFWTVTASANKVIVKPSKDGATTNLHLETLSGRVYSFKLTSTKGVPDSKVFVNAQGFPETAERPKYFAAAHVEALEAEADVLRNLAAAAKQDAVAAIAKFQQQYPAQLQFTYRLPKYEKPFYIRAIWNDGRFTYVRTDARELPALYEIVDGQPALIDYIAENGLFRVSKVLTDGYLALGKKRAEFRSR